MANMRQGEAKGLEWRVGRATFTSFADPTLVEPRLRKSARKTAMRYTRSGGVLVGLRRRGPARRIDVIGHRNWRAAEKRAEIFDEFVQLNNPGRDLGQGSASASPLSRVSPP